MHSRFYRCFKASLLEKSGSNAAVRSTLPSGLGNLPYPQLREMGHRPYIFLMRNQGFTEN